MRFGDTLLKSVYKPWGSKYVDYQKLKSLLREKDVAKDSNNAQPWTDEDEQRFVDELINIQLEKVNDFQIKMYKQLRDCTNDCQDKLDRIAREGRAEDGSAKSDNNDDRLERTTKLEDVLRELDGISKELNELERFSRVNFTALLKAAKKHDRRRGANYKVKPLLQVRLAALPFNTEDYSPFVYRLSGMYSFVRQSLGSGEGRAASGSGLRQDTSYTSRKFFVHPDNLLEVKTLILRHLPVLVYSPNSTKVADGSQQDPRITSLYFDSPNFSLYNSKIEKGPGASSLRLRWYGHLSENPEIALEKKTLCEGDSSKEVKLNIKPKYVQRFLEGKYSLENKIQKLRDRNGSDAQTAKDLQNSTKEIHEFIRDQNLQPMLRASYTRTAFQIPGNDRVRVSIDTKLALIREDCLNTEKPSRDPSNWHRRDIDDGDVEYPFSNVKKGEISMFPYAVMEIKIRNGSKGRCVQWVDEISSTHLVKEAPRFSKFVQGIASLFEDSVHTFPFWTSLTETDIQRDPTQAFQEEQEKKATKTEDEFVVGSLLASLPKSPFKSSPSPSSKPKDISKRAEDLDQALRAELIVSPGAKKNSTSDEPTADNSEATSGRTALSHVLPTISNSKYAQACRGRGSLPPGVTKPTQLIKDIGEIRVEPKVWLANQRTFIKWEHVSILLATFSLSLFNAARDNSAFAISLAIIYTTIAAFTAAWGWWIYLERSKTIKERSGKDLDRILGPIIVCVSLVVALHLNFGLRFYRSPSPGT